MSTTFQVIYLGTAADLDPVEGNQDSEDAATLVGTTFGTVADPLGLHIHTLTPGTTGYAAGEVDYYDTNDAGDTFSIDGGPDQVFDSTVGYNATITYTDGTTATLTAVIIQDTAGRLYLTTELLGDPDQAVLDAKPIRSISFDSGNGFSNVGLFHIREPGNFQAPICFAAGTMILTPAGEVPVETLRPGDRVCTADNGPQRLLWSGGHAFGKSQLAAWPRARPVLIPAGRYGARRPLLVSQQHGILCGDAGLIRARHLCDIPGSGARIAAGKRRGRYIHLLFERHQIIFADGVASESFYPGPMALRALSPLSRRRLFSLSGDLPALARASARAEDVFGHRARPLLSRRDLPAWIPAHI